jgi:hypothetical protein
MQMNMRMNTYLNKYTYLYTHINMKINRDTDMNMTFNRLFTAVHIRYTEKHGISQNRITSAKKFRLPRYGTVTSVNSLMKAREKRHE